MIEKAGTKKYIHWELMDEITIEPFTEKRYIELTKKTTSISILDKKDTIEAIKHMMETETIFKVDMGE